jgi:hypothetical protein
MASQAVGLTEANMDNNYPAASHPDEQDTTREILTAILDQGCQTLELVKALVALITPKGERNGPTLEDLLGKILNQQTQIITIAKTTQVDLARLGKTLPHDVIETIAAARALPS